jgi:hypothetical protein
MPLYYKRDGTPYPEGDEGFLEMARDWEDLGKKVVMKTELPWGGEVSTVWLGLDHGFMSSRPLIFETIVFDAVDGWSSLACRRYSTEEDAIKGHMAMVKEWTERPQDDERRD